VRVQREAFQFILQFYVLLLARVILQFYLLEHFVGKQGDAVASLEFTLLHPHKGLHHYRLSVLLGIFGKDVTNDREDRLTGLATQLDLLSNFSADDGIVLSVVVEIGIHEQLDNLEHLHVEVLIVFDQFEILDPHVDVRQLLDLSLVQIAQLHPTVHQPQRHLLVVTLVNRYLVVVVKPPRLFHQLSVRILEPLNYVDEE